MSKLTLVLRESDWTVFHAAIFESFFREHFDVKFYSPETTYDKSGTVFVSNIITRDTWKDQLLQDGYKVAIDNIWETARKKTGCHSITSQRWFWYNQCMINNNNGYSKYVPEKTYSKLALMPMRLAKPHRDDLVRVLDSRLDDIVYSYVTKGICLPNDLPHDLEIPGPFQQNFNPSWYNNTYFSIVAETYVHNNTETVFVTEKTFKPIGFFHPFVVCGQKGTLAYLHSLGFETFNNLFDESYDSVELYNNRLNKMAAQVLQFEKTPYDKLTWEKLTHNHALLNNVGLVKEMMASEIVTPIYEYANK